MADLDIPKGLSPEGKRAAEAIVAFLTENEATSTGGCRVFYTPEQWADRREAYGLKALLIVVHDGGDHAPYFNLDYCQYVAWEEMNTNLRLHGVYAEQCTGWYSAIYAA
jgi:hypothetical protein